MFKKLKNKRGSAEATVVAAWWIFSAIVTTYTMLPATRAEHQQESAIEICEYKGEIDCESIVADMSKDEILVYIADNDPNGGGFYGERWKKSIAKTKRTGGGLRARILALQE